MKYYLAPMEGLTTYVFRTAYDKYYGKGNIDTYFTPFLSNRNLSSRELNDILPEHNQGMKLVPQILTNRADEFLEIAKRISEFGYDTVNLNLGCPSGTVTAKKRGAGFLDTPKELDAFLEEIFTKCQLKISVKTRIGISETEEWDRLLQIYQKYPLEELIIHPRLQQEFYKGTPHTDAYLKAERCLSFPLCYNGDIVSAASFRQLCDTLPNVTTVMIGRGILMRPELLQLLKGTTDTLAPDTLQCFHEELLQNYSKIMSGDTPTLYKMKDLWTFLGQSFLHCEKHLKKIKKATSIADYQIAVRNLFRECPRQSPDSL